METIVNLYDAPVERIKLWPVIYYDRWRKFTMLIIVPDVSNTIVPIVRYSKSGLIKRTLKQRSVHGTLIPWLIFRNRMNNEPAVEH